MMLKRFTLLAAAMLAQTSFASAIDDAKAAIGNFGVVCSHEGCADPEVYRSNRSWGSDQGIHALENLGVKTVVNLMSEESCSQIDPQGRIHCIDMPISPYHVWGLEEEEFEQALATVLGAEQDGAVLINCQRGSDRTGILSAILEIRGRGCSDLSQTEQSSLRREIDSRMMSYGFNNLFYSLWRKEVNSWVSNPPSWVCD